MATCKPTTKTAKKKPKAKQPSFMNHLKPSAPTGKGLGKPKIQVR